MEVNGKHREQGNGESKQTRRTVHLQYSYYSMSRTTPATSTNAPATITTTTSKSTTPTTTLNATMTTTTTIINTYYNLCSQSLYQST